MDEIEKFLNQTSEDLGEDGDIPNWKCEKLLAIAKVAVEGLKAVEKRETYIPKHEGDAGCITQTGEIAFNALTQINNLIKEK